MDALEILKQKVGEAQNELAAAELALIEAQIRAENARTNSRRYENAVAALSGEPPPAAASASAEAPNNADEYPKGENEPHNTPSRDKMADLSPEEFDRERKRRQRQRQKEEQANNPYAHVKCSGCGALGTMQDSIVTAPSGAPLRMMVCGGCGNQIMQ